MTGESSRTASPSVGRSKSELIMGLAIISLIVAALLAWVAWTVTVKKGEVQNQVRERLELLASSRVEVFQSWTTGLVEQTDKLISRAF